MSSEQWGVNPSGWHFSLFTFHFSLSSPRGSWEGAWKCSESGASHSCEWCSVCVVAVKRKC